MDAKLDNEQRNALESLLSSTNMVSVFRGGAGTGKGFVLRELVEQVQQAGRPVVVLAPQRQAASSGGMNASRRQQIQQVGLDVFSSRLRVVGDVGAKQWLHV